jgi:hypothetical protein
MLGSQGLATAAAIGASVAAAEPPAGRGPRRPGAQAASAARAPGAPGPGPAGIAAGPGDPADSDRPCPGSGRRRGPARRPGPGLSLLLVTVAGWPVVPLYPVPPAGPGPVTQARTRTGHLPS